MSTDSSQPDDARLLLASIVESSDDAIVSKDLNGIVTSWNKSAERIFGYSAEEMIGRPISILAAPGRADETPAILERIGRGERIDHYQTLRRTKAGQVIHISLTVSPIRDAGGQITGASKVARDITAQIRAQAEIAEHRERLRVTLNSIGDAVMTTDPEGRVSYLNPVAERLTGWTTEAACGKPLEEIFRIVNEESRQPAENPVTKALREGNAVGLANHTLLISRDGQEIAIDDSAAPIKDARGGTIGVVLVFRDVQAQRAAARLLAEQAAELRRTAHLLERVPCFVRDLDDTIIHWNPGAVDLYGFSSEEAIGVVSHTLLKTEFSVPLPEIVSEVRTKGTWDGELVHTRRDGQQIVVASHWALYRDEGGRPIAILEVNRDITQRKEAERAIARVQEQLAWELVGTRGLHELGSRLMTLGDLPSLLAEILTAARMITGADKGNIQLLDPSGALRIEAQHGFSKEFLDFFREVWETDGSCGAALAARDRIVVEDVERSLIFLGKPALNVLLADGIRAVQSTPIVSRTGLPLGVLSTHYKTPRQPSERDLRLIDLLARQAADLIEQMRAEEALRVYNAALARANEDLNQFAYAASHDLQEPLRMISTYSELLKSYRGPVEGEAAVFLKFIAEGAQRMRELIRDLLAYTQLTGEDPAPAEPVDLNLVFSKALENLKVAVEDSRASVTSDRLPAVLGRETHFIQLFQNLIGNALKYRGAQPPRIHVSAAEANGGWRIAVADNGMGIDPAHHQMIFGLFKRLHGRALSGTGIGLAVCKRVVQRYGGRIWVESRLNQGATFYFTLPAEKGREFDAAPGGLCAL